MHQGNRGERAENNSALRLLWSTTDLLAWRSATSGRGCLIEQFAALSDPRQAANMLYPLPEIVLLLLCATLPWADGFVEAQLRGEQNFAAWNRDYLA